jgi:hypothetical protein
MGFEFRTDQPEQSLPSSSTTSLSVNEPKEDLTQIVYAEGEEEKLAIQFLEECGLYQKFLLWQGIQEQLKKLKDELAN